MSFPSNKLQKRLLKNLKNLKNTAKSWGCTGIIARYKVPEGEWGIPLSEVLEIIEGIYA